jgi:2-octaprenylphenol hydroxylase
MSARYDVVVIGAAMVGATTALALARGGLRVALVERSEPTPFKADAEYALRVSAISRASQRIFESLGVWEGMLRRRASPYRRMCVWDATGSGEIVFDAADLGEPDLGHIVENVVVQDALLERLRAQDEVDWFCPAALGSVEIGEGAARVYLQDGRLLEASLVVGADGARSPLRERLGIEWHERDYGQKAVVATVRTEGPHEQTAWQRFLPTGPLAFLPLADGRSSIVWSTNDEDADALTALDDADFGAVLTDAFGARLGAAFPDSPRLAFPLRGAQAAEYVRRRVALVGDAAHVIHPLAGQGANLGFLDAAALCEAVLEAGRDPGSLLVLRRYERARRAENLLMQRAMEGFRALFGSDWSAVRLARNWGLSVTDRMPPVKQLFIAHALGLAGDLPALARTRTQACLR